MAAVGIHRECARVTNSLSPGYRSSSCGHQWPSPLDTLGLSVQPFQMLPGPSWKHPPISVTSSGQKATPLSSRATLGPILAVWKPNEAACTQSPEGSRDRSIGKGGTGPPPSRVPVLQPPEPAHHTGCKGIGYLSLPRASQDMSLGIDMSPAQTSPGQRDKESRICNELQGCLSRILNFLLNCEIMEEFYRK